MTRVMMTMMNKLQQYVEDQNIILSTLAPIDPHDRILCLA